MLRARLDSRAAKHLYFEEFYGPGTDGIAMNPDQKQRSRFRRRLAAALFGPCLLLATARADIILGSNTWNAADDLEGWTADDQDWVTLGNPNSGGPDNSGYLSIGMDETTPFQFEEWEALAQAPATNLFVGTWTTNMWVTFDFFAEDIAPNYIQIWWGSDSDNVWTYTVASNENMTTQLWNTLSAPLFDYDNWSDAFSPPESEFLDDLAAIDWIGVYIFRDEEIAQDYGLDDFELHVPEPAEMMLLAAAVLTSAMSMRRKRRARAQPPG
jgi:hypothetical protein